MIFTFDVEEAAQKQGSTPAKPANHANPGGGISMISNFSKGEGSFSGDLPLPDSKMESRRQAVLTQLQDNPNIVRAVLIDERADPEHIIVAVAIRGVATFEMRVPKAKADAWTVLGLVDKHTIRPADGEPIERPDKPVSAAA